MIFKPELVKLIQQGKKTMTRRPVQPGDKSCRYQEGHVYSIQPGRGRAAVARITVTEVRMERLGQLTLPDAKREGFRTTAEFYAYWHRLYGPPVSKGVRDLERRLADLDPETDAARAIAESVVESRRRRAERLPLPAQPCLVWVISFVRGDVRDAPRLLRASEPRDPVCVKCKRGMDPEAKFCRHCQHPAPEARDDDHGYTERSRDAMSNEPEAVSFADQAKITKGARAGEAQLSLKPVRDRRERLHREATGLRRDLAEQGVSDRELTRQLGRIETALERIDELLAHAA